MPSKRSTYNPTKDIPDLSGKVIFITGATSGLGFQTILSLMPHSPAHIYFTGRNHTAAEDLVTRCRNLDPDVPVTFICVDFSSIHAVKDALAQFTHSRLDILICNAAVFGQPPDLTKDGYEIHCGVNFLGNAAVVQQLLPVLEKTAREPKSDVRILMLSSCSWLLSVHEGIVYQKLNTPYKRFFSHFRNYGQSKMANLLYVKELSWRFPRIKSVAVHPGIVVTELIKNLSFFDRWLIFVLNALFVHDEVVSPVQGSANILWCSTTARKENLVSGAYYTPIGAVQEILKPEVSEKWGSELWQWTEDQLGRF